MKLPAALLIASFCFAGEANGLRPRPDPDDYAARAGDGRITVAATMLSREEVKNAFATGLAPHYIVVEVAVYPGTGGSLELRQDDFVLRSGPSRTLVRPVDAKTIAARLHRKAVGDHRGGGSPSDITLYPSVGVGVHSGPGFPDGSRRTGVSTGVGVGVGIGDPGSPVDPPPGSSDADRRTMEVELSDKALPATKTAEPVAGYLYFPVTTTGKRKPAFAELEYLGGKSRTVLRIPAPREN